MKLMVIDGNSIVNRSFYGVRPLTTRDGLYTNAVYGFVTRLVPRQLVAWYVHGVQDLFQHRHLLGQLLSTPSTSST